MEFPQAGCWIRTQRLISNAAWGTFVAGYEKCHRAAMGLLRANAFAVVGAFLRCGDRGWRILRQAVSGTSRPVSSSHPPRAPFSHQKITWKPETQTVIYRSKPHHNTKRNFEIFKAADFIAALVDHIPPKSKHSVRYYGVYSNKNRGRMSRIPTRLVRAPKLDGPPIHSPRLPRPHPF